MRSLLTALSVVSVLAAAPSDLKTEEAQLKDVIDGVVGRYLGASNESKILSSALMKAFEEEGFGDDVGASTTSPETSTVSLEKRDIRSDALPPPELFLDLLGEDLDNPRRPPLHMEVAANAKRNCTKRKRRKKKSKTEPFKLPVGLTRTEERGLAEYTSSGVPPVHVEIPRLATGEHPYFDDETSPRPAVGARSDSHIAPDLKQRNQDKVAAFSELAPTSYQAPSTYFSLGSTSPTGRPPVRRNPFERFEQTTSLPFREETFPESRDVLVPKRGKTREFRTTTASPTNKFAVDVSDALIGSEPSQSTPARVPKVRVTPLEPPTDLQQPESAQYSYLPKSTTTLRPQTTRSASRSTATGNPYSGKGSEAGYRTLVPSSLNKGTLQHFSLYPKQPQSNSFSKIILAVGGARYAPLAMNITTEINASAPSNLTSSLRSDLKSGSARLSDSQDRATSSTGFYSTVVAKQTSSLAAVEESSVIQKPSDRHLPRQPEALYGTPGTLLPISPKVVSGQVMIFSSKNLPDEADFAHRSDEPERTVTDSPSSDGATTSTPRQTTDCVTHGEATTVRPEFGARMYPPASIERRTTTPAPSPSTEAVATDKPNEPASDQGFMPDAPTILMQVPLPDHPELANHGYVKGNAQLHIPLVYKLQKKDKTSAQRELTKERTLISLPNNPFARLNPVNTAYYKYRESDIKGYLPKAFIRLERVQNVKVNAQAPQRSMVVFE